MHPRLSVGSKLSSRRTNRPSGNTTILILWSAGPDRSLVWGHHTNQGAKAMVALAGQGMPLPHDCPYDGEWLLIDSLFLFRPTLTLPSSEAPNFTAGFQLPSGKWSAGFDSAILAKGLSVSIDELFEANRDGRLVLAGVDDVAPQHGEPPPSSRHRVWQTCWTVSPRSKAASNHISNPFRWPIHSAQD